MDVHKHHESHLVSGLTFLFLLNPTFAISGPNSTENVRVVTFLCGIYPREFVGFYYMKPAFDLAQEAVQKRFEDGTYKGFNISVTYSYTGCQARSLGSGVDLYTSQPYHAIFGPPISIYTIGKRKNGRSQIKMVNFFRARTKQNKNKQTNKNKKQKFLSKTFNYGETNVLLKRKTCL